jgi:hypothetical protein
MDDDVEEDRVEITAEISRFRNKEYHPTLEAWCRVRVTANAVEGIVADQRGNPVEGAKVDLKNLSEEWVTREKSGSDGRFRFEDWDPGRYEVKAQKEGYEGGKESREKIYLGRSDTATVELQLIRKLALDVKADPETLEADGKSTSEITASFTGPERQPMEGETLLARVQGEPAGELDPESAQTDPEGHARFTYTAGDTKGEVAIRVWPEGSRDLEKTVTIQQEAFPYFDVDFADKIIRVYKKEAAEERTRGLGIEDLEKVRILRTDRQTPFRGKVGLDRFLVAAVYAAFGYKQGDAFYPEQVNRCRELKEGSKELAASLKKQRYDADWYDAMAKGMADFKGYVDLAVTIISPPDPFDAAKTILAGGPKALATAFNVLLGVYSDMDKADSLGESWFSDREWLDKEYCMDRMREGLDEQIAALKELAEAAGELGKSWEKTQPGSDAPNLHVRQVLPLAPRSAAYQVLWHLWEYLRAERTRLWHYAQWKRIDSPPKLDEAQAILDIHDMHMEEQKAEAKKIEAMAESMKGMAEMKMDG